MVLEFLGDPVGMITTLGASGVAVYKAIQARDLGQGITALGKLMNPSNKEVTKTDQLNKAAQKVIADNPESVLMAEDLKTYITSGLTESRAADVRKIINQNENDGEPGDSYSIDVPEKGVKYEIFCGKIQNRISLNNIVSKNTTGDPGSCEIIRLWGGSSSSASNIPAKQPGEITMDMINKNIFVNCKATEIGGVTLGLFVDRKLTSAKILDFQANDITQARENNLSYSVYNFTIPSAVVRDARESDEEFDAVVAWARGGKWYYLLDTEGVEIPWEGQMALKVKCPAPVKEI